MYTTDILVGILHYSKPQSTQPKFPLEEHFKQRGDRKAAAVGEAHANVKRLRKYPADN